MQGCLSRMAVFCHRLERQYRMKEAAKKLLGDRLYARLWAMVNRREPGSDGGGEGAE